MALTNKYRNIIVDNLTGRKKSNETGYMGIAQVYIGLSSTAPTADGGNITEPSALTADGKSTGYGRTLIGKGGEAATYKFPAAASGESTNAEYIYFPEALATWGDTLRYFVLFDAATNGNVVAYAKLMKDGIEEPINVTNPNTVVLFRPGDLTIKYVDALELQ